MKANEMLKGIKMVCGIGNYGTGFEMTRHNCGFDFIDYLTRHLRQKFVFKRKLGGDLAENSNFLIFKPRGRMNEIGPVVKVATQKLGIAPEQLLIAHDDMELKRGRYNISTGTASIKGHNGLRSVQDALNSKDYLRLRLGIGRPAIKSEEAVRDFVMSPFSAEELGELQEMFDRICADLFSQKMIDLFKTNLLSSVCSKYII